MMHTLVEASLQADSRIDMFWKSMTIDVKSCRNGSQFGPWCALVSLRGSKITQKLPEVHPKGPQGDPRAPFGSPRGVPRATKSPQRAPRGSPRALLGGLGRGKIEKKSVTEAKNVDFSKNASRLGPADARSTLDSLKSSQNRARIVQSRFLSGLGAPFLSLWSLERDSDRLRTRKKPPNEISLDFHDFGRLQGGGIQGGWLPLRAR